MIVRIRAALARLFTVGHECECRCDTPSDPEPRCSKQDATVLMADGRWFCRWCSVQREAWV